jgi:hypothetical protein
MGGAGPYAAFRVHQPQSVALAATKVRQGVTNAIHR